MNFPRDHHSKCVYFRKAPFYRSLSLSLVFLYCALASHLCCGRGLMAGCFPDCALLPAPPPPPGVWGFSELSFITEPSDLTVLPKEAAVLDCQAHGQPPVTVKWLKNGVRLAESQHVRFLPNGSLYIPKIQHTEEESDEGFYQCLSQNRYGAILSQRSHLTIARKSAPVSITGCCDFSERSVHGAVRALCWQRSGKFAGC